MGERLWKIGDQIVDVSRRGLIMGVLNVTPDSFSDGGDYFGHQTAVQHGLDMAGAGADIIDIGGESTRPRAKPVTADEELRRIGPVIAELHSRTEVMLSIDTSKATVAEAAMEAGAVLVNDITGGRGDAEMLQLVARRGVGF